MDPFDPNRLRLPDNFLVSPTNGRRFHRTPVKIPFLKGPIPWQWLINAGRLPGKTLHVAIVLWHLVGLRKSLTVCWEPSKAKPFGMDRHTVYRALAILEKAGLVTVNRKKGRCPIVSILNT
ncbi:MAG TPA: helix-turn-helix domain-containing protein [Lacipirellulaceae bacterium]|jgi:hypothetical protein|nr:helix-turn-helix domain-containing protein [Lacipirellulaceae bacterium]